MHFSFDNKLYDQIAGVDIGSPLAPALANLFMGHHEKRWLENEEASSVLKHTRYVDDMVCLFKNVEDAENFFDFSNRQYPNVKFTMEKEVMGKLPFLDVLLDNSGISINTSTFRKNTYACLLTNYFSFTPFCCKIGLIKTLSDRAFTINISWIGFHEHSLQIKSTLQTLLTTYLRIR